MLIVRCVLEDDLDSLFDLIQKSEFGLTTLKISKDELESRIERSLFAFRKKDARPQGQPYVFVMEDLSSGRLVGTCAIYSKTGGFEPMYSYEIKKSIHRSEGLDVHKEIDTLHLLAQHDGPTEIGSLFCPLTIGAVDTVACSVCPAFCFWLSFRNGLSKK